MGCGSSKPNETAVPVATAAANGPAEIVNPSVHNSLIVRNGDGAEHVNTVVGGLVATCG